MMKNTIMSTIVAIELTKLFSHDSIVYTYLFIFGMIFGLMLI